MFLVAWYMHTYVLLLAPLAVGVLVVELWCAALQLALTQFHGFVRLSQYLLGGMMC
jgi:hypothetical protein